MKKFFASLLALVGMVAGLTLTSCGGGGGGSSNLSGITIIANGTSASYVISIGAKVDGSITSNGSGGAYHCIISDLAGSNESDLVMTVTKLEFGEDDKDGKKIKLLEATMAPASFEAEDNAAFFNLITGVVSTNKAITKLQFPEGAVKMIVDGDENTISWTGVLAYSAIADNSSLEEEITINLKCPLVAISKGSY